MRMNFKAAAALLLVSAFGAISFAQAPGGPPAGGPPRGGGFNIVQVLVESKAFPDGGVIPNKYSMYGGSTLPDFHISNLPATAQSIAIIFHDLDVAGNSNPEDVLHWMAWNIPVSGTMAMISEGKIPDGAVSKGMMRGPGFVGPGAPAGVRYHHYVFEFYVLSEKLNLPDSAGRPELLAAMQGKVVGKAAYVGRFHAEQGAAMPGMGGPPRAPGGN